MTAMFSCLSSISVTSKVSVESSVSRRVESRVATLVFSFWNCVTIKSEYEFDKAEFPLSQPRHV
jgi:hypothetical protein